jgi:hypothetical protein
MKCLRTYPLRGSAAHQSPSNSIMHSPRTDQNKQKVSPPFCTALPFIQVRSKINPPRRCKFLIYLRARVCVRCSQQFAIFASAKQLKSGAQKLIQAALGCRAQTASANLGSECNPPRPRTTCSLSVLCQSYSPERFAHK